MFQINIIRAHDMEKSVGLLMVTVNKHISSEYSTFPDIKTLIITLKCAFDKGSIRDTWLILVHHKYHHIFLTSLCLVANNSFHLKTADRITMSVQKCQKKNITWLLLKMFFFVFRSKFDCKSAPRNSCIFN